MSGKSMRETLGLVAVVASLVFVGLETQQNTAAVQSAALQGIAEMQIQVSVAMASDPGTPELIMRLRNGALSEDFTPEENQRVRLWYFAYIRVTHAAYKQMGVGAVAQGSYSGFTTGMFAFDYLRASWPTMSAAFEPGFAQFFEEHFVN